MADDKVLSITIDSPDEGTVIDRISITWNGVEWSATHADVAMEGLAFTGVADRTSQGKTQRPE